MDIIDFRYRPPYGSYRETIMYRDLERARRCSEAFGMTQSPAVAARDMEASLTEMDRAGIGMAVLAGRKVLPHIGVVDNQDIVDLIHAYPGRFTGMAGVDPSDGPEAMEVKFSASPYVRVRVCSIPRKQISSECKDVIISSAWNTAPITVA